MIIGLDTGGTHVDAVLIENGKILATAKTPTDKENLFECIWETLEKLLNYKDLTKIKKINLSTTISTNAIIEKKHAKTALFIEAGPGISPHYFSCSKHTVYLDGYIDHRGHELKPFKKEELIKKLPSIKADGYTSAAVITKFSTRNPIHELQIKDTLAEHNFFPITMGHTLSGKLNFPRRIYTAYLNSSIFKYFYKFAQAIDKALNYKGLNIPVEILKADGGTMSLKEATQYPVQSILSGPAASVMGSLAFYNLEDDALLLDIGGTTTDISFLADGVPLFVPDGIEIDNYPTLVRAIYNFSIGLGGDSKITIDNNKQIKIGPERQGPPMALGGPFPTPTDALIVLNKLKIGNKEKAWKAIKSIAQSLNLSPEDTAKNICYLFAKLIKDKVNNLLGEINSHPVYTIHQLLYGKKIEPENIVLIGGPAKAFSSFLENEFNFPCLVPEQYEVANAVGAALTRKTFEINLIADTERQILSVPELQIYKKINKNYNLTAAKKEALTILKEKMYSFDATYADEAEIIEATSFNMVRGFSTSGRNIRVKAQIKPGLITRIGGSINCVKM